VQVHLPETSRRQRADRIHQREPGGRRRAQLCRRRGGRQRQDRQQRV